MEFSALWRQKVTERSLTHAQGQWSYPVLTNSAPTRHSWLQVPKNNPGKHLTVQATCFLLLLLSRFSRVQLCDTIDGSPPGSPIPGILQARTLEWVAISFSNAWKWKVKSESEVAQLCPTLATPWTAAYQAPLSMGFSRQESWSGVPSPSPTCFLEDMQVLKPPWLGKANKMDLTNNYPQFHSQNNLAVSYKWNIKLSFDQQFHTQTFTWLFTEFYSQ